MKLVVEQPRRGNKSVHCRDLETLLFAMKNLV